MGKTKEQKLPKWFNGELYEIGDEVRNPYSGEKIELTAVELSMYDFVMGATMVSEMQPNSSIELVKDLRKGLDWFRQHSPKAYMVLLD
jgi:hypothetical protein